MQIAIIKEYTSGGESLKRYAITDDSGKELFVGSASANTPNETILANFVTVDPTPVASEMQEVTEVDKSMIDMKTALKNEVIKQIKIQASPTMEGVIAAMPQFDSDFAAFVIKTYLTLSAQKGYIASPAWDMFVADIKTTSVEELVGRV